MNKHCHRIIFNARRGQRMVVAETASAGGESASGESAGSNGAGPAATWQPLKFAVTAALGLLAWSPTLQLAQAQIRADGAAPASQRPIVLNTANGLPQVNIQTPSAAGVNITLSAVKDAIAVNAASSSADHQDGTQSLNETLRGTNLQSANNISLTAGRDITLQASNVSAAQGAATLQAAGSVRIESAIEQHQNNSQHTGTRSGLLSSTTTTQRKASDQSLNMGSAVSGSTVTVTASQDINVKGSSVISDSATTLSAGNNVSIEAATNTSRQTSFTQKQESGLMSSGGLGVSFGSREQRAEHRPKRLVHHSSRLHCWRHYRQRHHQCRPSLQASRQRRHGPGGRCQHHRQEG